MRCRPIVGIVLFMFLSCSRDGNLSLQDSATVKNDVKQTLSAMADSLHTRGLTGWLAFMHPSPEFYWEFHGARSSYDSLAAYEVQESRRFESIVLAWDSIRVEPIALDKATVFAHFVEVIVDTAGRHITFTGSVRGTAVNVSGQWKFQNGRTQDD